MRTTTPIGCLALLWTGVASFAIAASEPPRALARWLEPQTWEKDTAGPIISLGSKGDFDDMHIFAPAVIHDKERFLLWYCGSRGKREERVFRLGLATSIDGKRFERQQKNPVLGFADGELSVLTPALLRKGDGSVLREDGKLRMWFSAANLKKPGLHTLHESTSADGIQWAEPSKPLLDHVYCPSVLKTDKGYEMWYSDVSKRPWVIRHAASADGRKWNVTDRPVLQLSQDWEAEIVVYPSVLKIDGAYLMWYGSYYSAVRRQTTAVGFAASVDGLVWHKHPQNPVLRPDPKRPWESHYVGSGTVMRLADGSFRYWYASRTAPPFVNLYFAINTARWAGPTPTTNKQQKVDEPPAHVKKYLRRCDEAKVVAIRTKEAEIKLLQGMPDPTGEIQMKLVTVMKQLKQLQDRPAPLLPLPLPPKIGDIGVFETSGTGRTCDVDVLEVVDGRNTIIRAWHSLGGATVKPPAATEEVTFVDLWVRGITTSGLAAGVSARLPQVFHVTGTHVFETTCGRRSLPLVEPVEIERYR